MTTQIDEIDRRFEIADAEFGAVIEQYMNNLGFGSDESWWHFHNPLNSPDRFVANAIAADFQSQRESIYKSFVDSGESGNKQGRLTALADMVALAKQSKAVLLGINTKDGGATNDSEYPPMKNPDVNVTDHETEVNTLIDNAKDAAQDVVNAAKDVGVYALVAVGILLLGAVAVNAYIRRR